MAGELAPADLPVAVVDRAGQVEVGLDRHDADRRLHPVARRALAHGVDRKLRPPVPELAADDPAVPDVHRAVVERERLPERVDGLEGDLLRQVETAEEPGTDDDGVVVGVVAAQVAGVARVRHVLLARRGARAEREPAPRRRPGCGAPRRAQVEHVARALDDHAGVAEEPGAVGLVGCVDVEVAHGRHGDQPEVDRGRLARVDVRDPAGQPHLGDRGRPVKRQLERGDDDHEPVDDDLDRAAERPGDGIGDRPVDDAADAPPGSSSRLTVRSLNSTGKPGAARVRVEPVAHAAAERPRSPGGRRGRRPGRGRWCRRAPTSGRSCCASARLISVWGWRTSATTSTAWVRRDSVGVLEHPDGVDGRPGARQAQPGLAGDAAEDAGPRRPAGCELRNELELADATGRRDLAPVQDAHRANLGHALTSDASAGSIPIPPRRGWTCRPP